MAKGEKERRGENRETIGSGRGEIVTYQPGEGRGRLEVRVETAGYETNELDQASTCAKNAQVAADGKWS